MTTTPDLPLDPLLVDEPEPVIGRCKSCGKQLHGDASARALCQACERSTAGRLEAMPRLYAALKGHLLPGTGSPGPRPMHTAAGPGLPLSERVLDLRGPGGVVGVLEDWRAALHDELEWSPPRVYGTHEARLERAVRGLLDNLLWIADGWEVAGDFVREVRELHGKVCAVLNPDERGIAVGACPAMIGGSVLCGSTLRAQPGALEITCSSCGCRFGPDQWLRLRGWQLEDEKAGV